MNKTVGDYKLKKYLYGGQFCKVYEGECVSREQKVIVKVIRFDFYEVDRRIYECVQDLLKWQDKSQNLIKIMQVLKSKNNVYLIFEYCNGGTLQDVFERKQLIGQKKANMMMKQILEGIRICNQNGVQIKHLSLNNIMFHNGRIKIPIAYFISKEFVRQKEWSKRTWIGHPIFLRGQESCVLKLGLIYYLMIFDGRYPREIKYPFQYYNRKWEIEIEDFVDGKRIIQMEVKELLLRMLVDDRKRIELGGIFREYEFMGDGKLLKKIQ